MDVIFKMIKDARVLCCVLNIPLFNFFHQKPNKFKQKMSFLGDVKILIKD
jgi:hypothetical protein